MAASCVDSSELAASTTASIVASLTLAGLDMRVRAISVAVSVAALVLGMAQLAGIS